MRGDRSTFNCAQSEGGVEVQRGSARSGAHPQRSEVRDTAQGLLYEGDINLRTTEIHQ